MGSLSAAALLRLPVRLHGIQLGQPTDLLLDVESWHALGFVVHCGDDSVRFLPWAASQPSARGDCSRLRADAAGGRRVLRQAEHLVSLARRRRASTRRGLARRVDRRRRRGHRARDRTGRRRAAPARRQARGFARREQPPHSYSGRLDGGSGPQPRPHRAAHPASLGAARQVLRRRCGRLRRSTLGSTGRSSTPAGTTCSLRRARSSSP